MRGARNEYAMILIFERPGFGIWSYGTSDWGWLASTVVSMACQSQKGIYWLDLADTILVDFGDICSSYGVLFFGWGWFSSFSWLDSAHNNIFFSYIEPSVWCMSASRQIFAVL